MPLLSQQALNRATLARQLLLDRAPITPLAAIERLVGMQAQVPKPPFIGLWTRLAKFRREDLIDLIGQRKVVRATMMRATIHLMTRDDYLRFRSTIQRALTDGLDRIAETAMEAIDVEAVLEESRSVFGKPCTFDTLRDHLARRFPGSDHRALAYAARLRLHLVQVPDDSRWGYRAACDFALAETILGKQPSAKDETHALIRRYLAAFGPATPADMQNWSALPLSSIKPLFEELRQELVTFSDDRKRELFDLRDAPRPDESTPAPIRFLPEYDNVLLGHADRTRIISDDHRKRIATANLRILATFLVDGRVAGTWTTMRKKNTATMEITPFIALSSNQKNDLREEGKRLLQFIEDDATKFDVRVAKKN